MADLFGEYELLAKSGLFDAAYYVEANPDVAALGIDPLMHYLETGAVELRNPSGRFDARHYVRLCQERGERIKNPLLHYLKSGAAQGLAPAPHNGPIGATRGGDSAALPPVSSKAPQFQFALDQVRIEPGPAAGRMIGSGWCLAASPIVELEVQLGSVRVRARYGLPRADVALTFPRHLKSDHSGFEFSLEPVAQDQTGMVDLVFTAKTGSGDTARGSISIDLDAIRAAGQGHDTGAERAFSRPPMQLCVDSAAVDEAGILHIVGWVVCLAPIASVDVFVDEQALARAEHGKPREDVGSAYAEYPNARHSGFALHTDIRSYGSGNRTIKIQAVASTGISRETIWPCRFPEGAREPAGSGDDSKIQCFCDLIEVTTGGQVFIKGWAVAAAATESIAVLFDGDHIGEADIDVERPDVGNLFPARPHARRAGFSFCCALTEVSAGEHLIILRHRADGDDTDILLPVAAVAGAGLNAQSNRPSNAETRELLLSIDLPEIVDGALASPVRGNLEIAGWALARRGIASVDVAIDGERVKSVSTGIRRPDVQRAHPDWDGALTAGFSALLPHRALPTGRHKAAVSIRDQAGQTARTEFVIEVEDASEAAGPWALCRRISPSELDLRNRLLLGNSERSFFGIVLPLPAGAPALERARATLGSLAAQPYESWRLYIVIRSRANDALRRELLRGFEELSSRVVLVGKRTLERLLAAGTAASHLMLLRPGDVLGCDALLEFAIHATLHPEADFLYADERRLNPASDKIEAFFKPQWSPDLMLSMNYLGRAWCARASLFRRAAIRPSELGSAGSYDLALRLTERATAIRHVPVTLLQATDAFAENDAAGRKALERSLARRGITATVKPGRTKGTFCVRRSVATRSLVSIIIPTCAAGGVIRTCIETLRSLTAYRNFEIVCIENIPAEKQDWKDWLRQHADRVIETAEPFNWSRFNNLAVAASRGEFLLFLNDDIEIIDAGWLHALLEHAERPEVGIVGPQLLYPDRRVQHAGMFLADLGVARHAFRFAAADDPGYFGLALAQRNVIAVTGACLMTRRETFDALGGFDETHDVVNNDVDFCLRAWRRGLFTVYTPHTSLVHHEAASRYEMADSYNEAAFKSKWRSVFVEGDPFFHARFTKERDDYSFDWEPTKVHGAGHPVLPHDSIRRILIVKLDHIGDCVIALPAIRRLKRYFPAATICVLTARASKAIWALEPAIAETIEFEFFHARSSSGLLERTDEDWRELSARLAPYRFDLAIDLRKHWETRPVLQHTGARYLAGYDMKGRFPWLDVALESVEDSPLLPKRQHTTDDLINLIDAVAAASEMDRALISPLPTRLSHEAISRVPRGREIFRKRVVCVHPFAGNEMKQWPLRYFSLLVDQLVEMEDVHVILIGGADEVGLAPKIMEAIAYPDSVWSLIGTIGLGELPALIGRCALFVGNDSGPKHIASGLGVPTVGIHSGIVDAHEWGPKGISAVAIQRAMTCSPCYHSSLEDCGRGLACLHGLPPSDVISACRRLLALSGSTPSGERAQRRRKRPVRDSQV